MLQIEQDPSLIPSISMLSPTDSLSPLAGSP